MVAAGHHGRKAGRGYYDYSGEAHRPGDPEPPDTEHDPSELPDGGVIEAAGVQLISLAEGSLTSLAPRPEEVGWFALPPVATAPLVELTRGEATTGEQAAEAERYFTSRGKHVEWVGDAPGLVLGRIVCQLVNEAAFALGKGIGSAEDIDTAMRLGFNYPRGPLEWGAEIGYARVLGVLDALHRELGEERYRAAPLLRRMAASG
jgi:3-hydroxybutyryl-CoA dehydrogenase